MYTLNRIYQEEDTVSLQYLMSEPGSQVEIAGLKENIKEIREKKSV